MQETLGRRVALGRVRAHEPGLLLCGAPLSPHLWCGTTACCKHGSAQHIHGCAHDLADSMSYALTISMHVIASGTQAMKMASALHAGCRHGLPRALEACNLLSVPQVLPGILSPLLSVLHVGFQVRLHKVYECPQHHASRVLRSRPCCLGALEGPVKDSCTELSCPDNPAKRPGNKAALLCS